MPRVTMNLSASDVANVAGLVEQLPAIRTKTHAVSTSIAFTSHVVDLLREPGAELLVQRSNGVIDRIVVPDLRPPEQEEQAAAARTSGQPALP